MYWNYIAVAWNALLLLCTLVLTIQMRSVVRKDFNEAVPLSFMIYSHTLFVVMRLIDLGITTFVSKILVHQFLSIIYSLDILAALAIYFGPKFVGFNKEAKGVKKFRFMPTVPSTNIVKNELNPSETPALILSTPKTHLGYLASNPEVEKI